MSNALDLAPDFVPITHWAGDTLKINVKVDPPSYVSGVQWWAQVRADRSESSPVYETFAMTLIPEGVCAELTPEQTRRLAEMGKIIRSVGCFTRQEWTGWYDVQGLFPDGCVQTFVHGTLTEQMDLTRVEGVDD